MNNKTKLLATSCLVLGISSGFFLFHTFYSGSFLYSLLREPSASKAIDESLIRFAKSPEESVFNLPKVVATNRNIQKVINNQSVQERLRNLYLEGLDPRSLKPQISKLSLTSLTLIDCKNNKIPDEIFTISTLTYLEIGNCNLNNLDKNISNLTQLRTLKLYLNNLSSLPDSLSSLSSLETLDLRGNNLTTIPKILYSLPNLKFVNLEGNKIDKKLIDELNNHLNTSP